MTVSFMTRHVMLLTAAVSFARLAPAENLLLPTLRPQAEALRQWTHASREVTAPNEGRTAMETNWKAALDTFWEQMKKLGEAVDEESASRLRSAENLTIEEEIVLIAKEFVDTPEKVRELGETYGTALSNMTFELYDRRYPGAFKDEDDFRQRSNVGNRPQDGETPFKLFLEHSVPEYRLAWEAWLLAPNSEPRGIMRRRIDQALEKIGTAQTAKLALFVVSSIAESNNLTPYLKRLGTERFLPLLEHRGSAADELEWKLYWLTLAESGRFADVAERPFENFYDMFYKSLAGRKDFAPAVRKLDLTKVPPKTRATLQRLLATYEQGEGKRSKR